MNFRNSYFLSFPLLTCCLLLLTLTVSGCNPAPNQQAVTAGLFGAGAKGLIKKAETIIWDGLNDTDPYVQANAIEVAAATNNLKFMPIIEKLLASDFVPVRFAAALAVGDFRYLPAKRRLKILLNAPDRHTKIAAAYALSKLGSDNSLTIVKQALTAGDINLQANAALLLGKSGDKTAIQTLKVALKNRDSNNKVRIQIFEALAMLGDTDDVVLKRLWAAAFNAYAEDRIIAVRALGAIGTQKTKEILITKLDDDVLAIRLAAAEQLGSLASSAGEPEVLDCLTKRAMTARLDKAELEQVNVLAALAIGRIRTPALMKFLPKLLKNKSKFVRIAAAKAVLQTP